MKALYYILWAVCAAVYLAFATTIVYVLFKVGVVAGVISLVAVLLATALIVLLILRYFKKYKKIVEEQKNTAKSIDKTDKE